MPCTLQDIPLWLEYELNLQREGLAAQLNDQHQLLVRELHVRLSETAKALSQAWTPGSGFPGLPSDAAKDESHFPADSSMTTTTFDTQQASDMNFSSTQASDAHLMQAKQAKPGLSLASLDQLQEGLSLVNLDQLQDPAAMLVGEGVMANDRIQMMTPTSQPPQIIPDDDLGAMPSRDSSTARSLSEDKIKDASEVFREESRTAEGNAEGAAQAAVESNGCWARFERVVKSQTFEWVMAGLILANALTMMVGMQYNGIDYGHTLGINFYDRPAAEVWPGTVAVLDFVDKMFVVLFTSEIMTRLAAYGAAWFSSGWSHLDIVVVGLAWVTWLLPSLMTMNGTIFRLFRLGKLLRIVRITRQSSMLESLNVLVLAIGASFSTLFWSLCVLLLIQLTAGMLLSQLVEPSLTDTQIPFEKRQKIFLYYGTFWRSTVTMFEVTFANWSPPCRLLLDEVNELFGVFFLIYRCAVGFAVLSVIQAVFIQQTMKSVQVDDNLVFRQAQAQKAKYADKLGKFFRRLDEDGNGRITWEEFEPLLTNTNMRVMMSTLEVDVSDIASLFSLLANEEGGVLAIDTDAFVQGVQNIKGTAKALDVVIIQQTVNRLEAKLDRLGKDLCPTSSRSVTLQRPPLPAHQGSPRLDASI